MISSRRRASCQSCADTSVNSGLLVPCFMAVSAVSETRSVPSSRRTARRGRSSAIGCRERLRARDAPPQRARRTWDRAQRVVSNSKLIGERAIQRSRTQRQQALCVLEKRTADRSICCDAKCGATLTRPGTRGAARDGCISPGSKTSSRARSSVMRDGRPNDAGFTRQNKPNRNIPHTGTGTQQ